MSRPPFNTAVFSLLGVFALSLPCSLSWGQPHSGSSNHLSAGRFRTAQKQARSPKLPHGNVRKNKLSPNKVKSLAQSAGNGLAVTRRIPHIPHRESDFNTRLFLTNINARKTSVTLVGYAANGSVIDRQTLELQGSSYREYGVDDLFAAQRPTHIGIAGCEKVMVAAAYSHATDQRGGVQLAGTRATGQHFQVSLDRVKALGKGLALVNTAAEPVALQAVVLGKNGQATVLQDFPQHLNGMAKLTLDLSDLAETEPGGVLRITSDQPLSLATLRRTGNRNSRRLLLVSPILPVK